MKSRGKCAVTVVITAYNLEKYIDASLEELYRQTMKDFDILIIDDASADRTVQIIKRWRARFGDRLKIICLDENLGLPALVRNVALGSGCIKGEYVIFLDGDDCVEPDMIEKLYTTAVKNHADAVICAYDRVEDVSGKVICTEMRGFNSCLDLPPLDDTLAFINTAPWNKLWRYEVISDLRYPGIRVGEEVTFNMAGYSGCCRIAFVDDVLIHYRVRSSSVISGTKEEMVWAFAEALAGYYEQCSGIYKDIMELTAFIHIGLSMGLRAADDPNIGLGRHVRRTRIFFREHFNWMRGNRFFRFSSLCRHGKKGAALWVAFLAYRCGFFMPILKCYRILSRVFGMEVRF